MHAEQADAQRVDNRHTDSPVTTRQSNVVILKFEGHNWITAKTISLLQ